MIFQQSMGKAGIRRAHVARCVIYSFDAMIWPTALFALALAMQSAEYPYFDAYEPIVSTAGIAVLVTIPLIVYRLARAYQRYLRFDHALAVVASVQLIVLLIVLVLAAGYYWVNYS
jgi:chromate transport protein ChrA